MSPDDTGSAGARLPILGPAFPFRIAGGGVAWASGAEKLAQNLRHLLLTRIGERAMRRDYGGGLQAAVHEPNDAALVGLVRHEVTRAIRGFAPEIELLSEIEVTARGSELRVAFAYRAAPVGGVARLDLAVTPGDAP